MSTLANITDAILEGNNEAQVNSESTHDLLHEMNHNLNSMVISLTSSQKAFIEGRREDRDNALDKSLKEKIKKDRPQKMPSSLRPRGPGVLGLLGALAGVSTGLIGGLVGILSRWEQKKNDIDESIQGTLAAINGIVAMPTITKFLTRMTKTISSTFSTMLKIITKITAAVLFSYKGLKLLGSGISKTLSKMMSGFKAFSGVLKTVGKTFAMALKTVSFFLRPFLRFGGALLRFFGRISGVFTVAIAFFDGVRAFWKKWEAGVRNPFALARAAIEGAVNGFLSLIGDVGRVFGWLAEKLLGWLGFSREASAKVKAAIVKSFDFIQNSLMKAVSFITGIFESVGNAIMAGVKAPGKAMRMIGEKILSLFDKLKNAIEAVWEGIKKPFKWVLEKLGISNVGAETEFERQKAKTEKLIMQAEKARASNNPWAKQMEIKAERAERRLEKARLKFENRKLPTAAEAAAGVKAIEKFGIRLDSRALEDSRRKQVKAQFIRNTNRVMAFSAPTVTSNSSNVAVSQQSQTFSVSPSAANRTDPHLYGVR